MTFKQLVTAPVKNRKVVADKIYSKSIEVVKESQFAGGGTGASLKGSRYYGHTYPRDHSYTTRAFVAAGLHIEAKEALRYILTVEKSPEGVMFQRYDADQKSSSNKPPQIDGNALTLIAVSDYVRKFNDTKFVEKYREQLTEIVNGLRSHLHEFGKGSLVHSVNAINEFAPYEEGFELYTNACTCQAFYEAAEFLGDPSLTEIGSQVQKGIEAYLYIPEYGGLMTLVRREPNPSITNVANLTGFLAITDFEIIPLESNIVEESISFQLKGSWNEEIGAYNRYAATMGRHNFGNGPWPMVMLRLASYFVRSGKTSEAEKAFDWVLNVAALNEDVEYALPEHVVTKQEIEKEFGAFMRTFDINPREDRVGEYKKNIASKMMEKYEIAYPINPLVWSHSMFLIVWNDMQKLIVD